MFERRCPGFANVDSDWNRRPSSPAAKAAQSFRDRVRTVVVKTETIDQCLLLGKPKDARLGISRLRFRSHRSDLDETKTQRRPRREGDPVFIQSSRKSDRIWKVEAEERFRFCWQLKKSENAQRDVKMRSAAKQ